MSHLLPTDKSPGPGPDLFFAGGECWSRFGVLVRRTDMDLEAATRPTATRNSVAGMTRGDGVRKQFGIDLPRVDWLNEVDIDPTRNLLVTTRMTDATEWNAANGLEVITSTSPGRFVVTDDTTINQGAADLNGNPVPSGGNTLTASVRLKKATEPVSTVALVIVYDGNHSLVIDPFTGEFAVGEGTPDAVRVTDLGTEWLLEIVRTATPSDFNYRIFPAFAPAGDISGVGTLTATGTAQVRTPQCEVGDVATVFQETPRDREYKFPNLYLELNGANVFTFTEALENAVWAKTRATIDQDVELSPDGQVTADKLVEDTQTNTHNLSRDLNVAGNDTTQAFAVFAKAAGRKDFRITYVNKAGQSVQIWFDLELGTVGTPSNGEVGVIRALDNVWFR